MSKKSTGCLLNGSILSLNNTILLWFVRNRKLSSDSVCVEIGIKVCIQEFRTIIGSHFLYSILQLITYQCVECLERMLRGSQCTYVMDALEDPIQQFRK